MGWCLIKYNVIKYHQIGMLEPGEFDSRNSFEGLRENTGNNQFAAEYQNFSFAFLLWHLGGILQVQFLQVH